MMKLHSSTSLLKQKRIWIPAGVVAAVLIIGAATWSLASVRQTYILQQADKSYDAVVKLVKTTLPTSNANREQRLSAIASLADETTPKINCEGEWWNNWQRAVLPSVKTAASNCDDQRKHLNVVADAAKQAQSYLKVDATVADQLAKLKIDAKSKTWQQDAVAAANEVQRVLTGMEMKATSDEAKGLVTDASGRTKVVVDTWRALNQASKKEDKEAYLNAQDKLSQAYADLSAISDVSDEQVEKTIQAFASSVAKLGL